MSTSSDSDIQLQKIEEKINNEINLLIEEISVLGNNKKEKIEEKSVVDTNTNTNLPYDLNMINNFFSTVKDCKIEDVCSLLQKFTNRVLYLSYGYINSYSSIEEFIEGIIGKGNKEVKGFGINVGNIEKGLNIYHGHIGSDSESHIYIFREDLSLILREKSS